MSLYYKDEFVELYHGDCITEHHEWLDAHVLVTDPPYGMAYSGFGGRKGEPRRPTGKLTVAGDKDTSIRDAALDAWGDRPAITFGKWTVERPAGVKARLIWDKTPCGFITPGQIIFRKWEDYYGEGKHAWERELGQAVAHEDLDEESHFPATVLWEPLP